MATQLAGTWAEARMRRGAGFRSEVVDEALEADLIDPGVSARVELWRDAAGEEPTFVVERESVASTLELTRENFLRPHVVPVRVNGEVLRRCIINTGAGATVLSPKAAEESGVLIGGEEERSFRGFTEESVRAGFVETLQIGDITLHDLPVFVGHERGLSALGIDAALGVDLMYHLRFTLRYATGEVLVEPVEMARGADEGAEESLELPLWTLPYMTLCDARYQGAPVRLMIDTGNYVGALVSTAWAQANLPLENRSLLSSLVGLDLREYTLTGLVLGDVEVGPWTCSLAPKGAPAFGGIVDIAMGQDLLEAYDVTIDLRRRVLRLVEP